MPDTLNWSTMAPHSVRGEGKHALTPAVVAGPDHAPDALAPGTRLDEFEIVRVLGAGGFGIVYLAVDQVLQRQVAIKEYMPTALAGRRGGAMVSVRSPTHAATFALGLESFFNEARMLASFDHPSLVKVHRVWKANGTAYMVMPYYAGQTLKEARMGMSAAPDERWLHALVEPLLGALDVLHRDGVYHRDISPDNILLLPEGRPMLLDFGSARRVVSDRTQSLTAILKPNFAPVEQYADQADMRQGPWTDLYALGATVHFMLTGQAPSPAVLRAVRDGLPALSGDGGALFPGVPMQFLATIDWTLALAPDDRPQSVAVVRQAFSGKLVPPPPSPRHAATKPADMAVANFVTAAAAAQPFAKTAWAGGGTGGASGEPSDRAAEVPPRPAKSTSRATGRAGWVALAMAGLGALGWTAWMAGQASAGPVLAGPVSVTSPVNISAAVSPPAPAPAPVPVPAPAIIQPTATAAPSIPARASAVAASPAPMRIAAVAPSQAPAASGVSVVQASKPAATASAIKLQQVAKATPPEAAPMAPDATRSPSEFCGGHNFFTRTMCVHRECQTPRWRAHPECVAARQAEEQRQRRMDQY